MAVEIDQAEEQQIAAIVDRILREEQRLGARVGDDEMGAQGLDPVVRQIRALLGGDGVLGKGEGNGAAASVGYRGVRAEAKEEEE